MAHRCPAADVVGPVILEDYKLLFRGNYRGNGVATIKPHKGRKVYGLLWRITSECEKVLDVYEGFPRLYEKQSVTIRDAFGQKSTVMAYVMTELCRNPAPPSEGYYQGIREGFLQNGLPVKALERAVRHAEKEAAAFYCTGQSTLWPDDKPKKGGRGMNDEKYPPIEAAKDKEGTMSESKIKVLVVEPLNPCYVQEISGLKAMQELVGGHIEAVHPFTEPAAIVCNEEGKFLGLPYNRPLCDRDGVPYDIICGTFFIAGVGTEDFVSLTDTQIHRFKEFYDNLLVIPAEKEAPKHAGAKKKLKNNHER